MEFYKFDIIPSMNCACHHLYIPTRAHSTIISCPQTLIFLYVSAINRRSQGDVNTKECTRVIPIHGFYMYSVKNI
jgi:hypothetical protein